MPTPSSSFHIDRPFPKRKKEKKDKRKFGVLYMYPTNVFQKPLYVVPLINISGPPLNSLQSVPETLFPYTHGTERGRESKKGGGN
jgi:hypothetical protein